MGLPAEKLSENLKSETIVIGLISSAPNLDAKRLRDFGLVMGCAFALISVVLAWKGRPTVTYTLAASLFFVSSAYLAPAILSPLERAWMWFGEKMSIVMTFVLMTLTFFIVMTPIALLLRLIRKDILDLKLDKAAKSYWKKPEADSYRPFLPY